MNKRHAEKAHHVGGLFFKENKLQQLQVIMTTRLMKQHDYSV